MRSINATTGPEARSDAPIRSGPPFNRGRPSKTFQSKRQRSNDNSLSPSKLRALGSKFREALILAILLALSALVMWAPTGGLGR